MAPSVDIKTPAGCQHINAWWLKWKLSRKYQLAMVEAAYKHSINAHEHMNAYNICQRWVEASPDFCIISTGLPDICAVIGDRWLALFEHVRCLPEGAPAHDAPQVSVELLAGTTSVPDWRRKPGRPRSCWLRDVLKDVHLTAQEAWTAADDREGWRAQRSSVDYAF